MSPEQADGKSGEAGSAADQYSLGVMLFEMVTGRLPFEGPVEVVLFHHIETLPPRPRSLIPRLSRDLEGVILRCLAKEPGKRYSSCEELAEDLRRWQSGEPVRARPLTWAERAAKWAFRNPAVAALLVVVAVVTAVGAGPESVSCRMPPDYLPFPITLATRSTASSGTMSRTCSCVRPSQTDRMLSCSAIGVATPSTETK